MSYCVRDWRITPINTDTMPTLTAFYPEYEDRADLAMHLRQAFAFFRRHGDSRYSAQSLMKLLSAAEVLEDLAEDAPIPAGLPRLVVGEVPFAYDVDTEVKTGGALFYAVVLAEESKTMLAVHNGKRRCGLGRAAMRMVRDYINDMPVVWVHRANLIGQQFCLSQNMQPWYINRQGAVQWSSFAPVEEASDAVDYCDDGEVENMVRRQARLSRARPVRASARPRRVMDGLYAEAPVSPPEGTWRVPDAALEQLLREQNERRANRRAPTYVSVPDDDEYDGPEY